MNAIYDNASLEKMNIQGITQNMIKINLLTPQTNKHIPLHGIKQGNAS